MKLPKDEAGLFLTHNEFKGYYQTAEEWVKKSPCPPVWQSGDERKKAIDTNEIWTLQWYPNTPVGFNLIAASTLENLLEFAATFE